MASVRRPKGTGSRLEAAMASQRKFMEVYGDPLEQLLNVLVFMVPIQDDEDDVAGFGSQAVYSVIDLFNLYRAMVKRRLHSLPVLGPSGKTISIDGSLDHQEDSSALQAKRLTYTTAAFLLRVLRSVQVLIEMYAHRSYGRKYALRVCMRVEAVKIVLKMVVHSQTPFSFYIDEETVEEAEPAASLPVAEQDAEAAPENGAGAAAEAFVGRRSGRTLPALQACAASNDDASITSAGGFVGRRSGRTLPALEAGPPRMLRSFDPSQGNPQMWCAELLYHSRPLVHLWLLVKRGPASWVTWFFALAMDRLSLEMLTRSLRTRALVRTGTRAARLELGELARRRQLLWWALSRSPVFDKVLKRPCEVLDRIISKIPILNLFRIMELLLALQPFYFSTSAT